MKLNKLTITLSLLLSATSHSYVIAADDLVNATVDYENVVVYGQKIERTVQQTKESVAIVSEAFADEIGLLDIEDVYLTSANVSTNSNGENFAIRGISQNSQSTGGGSGELGSIYIDGVAFTGFSTRFGPRDLWDVAQIEVLRGPQSTNVGRQALIGAVVIKTNDPSLDGFDAAVRGQVGNFGTYSAEGVVNVTLSDSSAIRLTAETFSSDGFIDNEILDTDYNPSETRLLRGKYLFKPSEDFNALITIQYAELEQGWNNYRFDLQPIDSFTDSSNLVGIETYDGVSSSIDLSYQFSDTWSLRSVTSYIDGDYFRFNDDDASPLGGNAFRGRIAQDTNFAEELRFTYQSEVLEGVIGIYYTEVDLVNDTTGLVGLSPDSLGVPSILLPFYPELFEVDVLLPFERNSRNIAVFTEWDWKVAENITLSAGFRYDTEQQDTQSGTANSLVAGSVLPDPIFSGQIAEQLGFDDATVAAVVSGITQVNGALENLLQPVINDPIDTTFNAFLPQIGITYELSDTHSLSAFYKRGYRAGGADVDSTGDISEFDSEFLDNFEVAYRSSYLDGSLVLNANAYYGLWIDQQVTFFVDNLFDTEIVNAGESSIYGLELEMRYQLTEDTNIFFTLGLAQTQFDDFCFVDGRSEADIIADNGITCEAGQGVGQNLAGFNFAVSPEVTAAIGGRHYITNNWYLSGNVTYQGSTFSDIQNTSEFENDSFVLVNLNLGYVYNDFEAKVFARNLFDEFYTNVLSGGIVTPEQRFVQPGVPREVGLLVSYRF